MHAHAVLSLFTRLEIIMAVTSCRRSYYCDDAAEVLGILGQVFLRVRNAYLPFMGTRNVTDPDDFKDCQREKKRKEQRGHWPLSGLRRMRKHSIIMWRQSLFAVFQDHAHNKNYRSHRKHGCHSSTPTAGCHPGQSHLHVWCHRIA